MFFSVFNAFIMPIYSTLLLDQLKQSITAFLILYMDGVMMRHPNPNPDLLCGPSIFNPCIY